jgi:predicted RNase H-like HicB family nuclease
MQREHSNTTKGVITVKSYVFRIELAEEDDGRWSAWIDTLPGCAAWGYTKDEALHAIHDAAEAYVEDMLEAGQDLPKEGVLVVDAPVVTITQGV